MAEEIFFEELIKIITSNKAVANEKKDFLIKFFILSPYPIDAIIPIKGNITDNNIIPTITEKIATSVGSIKDIL